VPFMPFQVVGLFLRGLLSLVLLGVGAYLIGDYLAQPAPPPAPERHNEQHASPNDDSSRRAEGAAAPGPSSRIDWPLIRLIAGIVLLAFSLGGGGLCQFAVNRLLHRDGGADEPDATHGGQVHRLRRPDGTELYVEVYGPPDAPPLVLTHGWGLDCREWVYIRRALAGRCRLIVWDLPGLGQSKGPDNKDWSLEKLARDLEEVLKLANGHPAVLVGHSIGGMIILTFCRLFPEAMGPRVSGIVLVQTTYTNPVRTAYWAKLYTALQKPVIEPLCWIMVWLAPLFWVMNWLSYLNGSAHRSTERSSFSGKETRGQLDFIAGYIPKAWPEVTARGMLGMLGYDATAVLPAIRVPTLVVAGDKDPLCTPEGNVFIQKAIQGAGLVTLSPARHAGLFEHHATFAAALEAFIPQVAPLKAGTG
jgi:pimeloyl-ACP methyl ester carboxylesterase